MYTSHRRNFLRQAGVDIEISVVINIKDGKAHHTGKYRYLVSQWDKEGVLIKNHYSEKNYDNYYDAEDAALKLGFSLINVYTPLYSHVD